MFPFLKKVNQNRKICQNCETVVQSGRQARRITIMPKASLGRKTNETNISGG